MSYTPPSWPKLITTHAPAVLNWSERDDLMRRCPFCYSLHPGDVLSLLQRGVGMEAILGNPMSSGFLLGNSDQRAVHLYRFWPQHLYDAGFDENAWEALVEMIWVRTQYWFTWESAGGAGSYRWGRGPRPKVPVLD